MFLFHLSKIFNDFLIFPWLSNFYQFFMIFQENLFFQDFQWPWEPWVMTIWVKFQENYRGCIDHFLRIDTEWPFRDRKSRFIILLSSFSAITREPLKVCWQVKHCKKGFRETFQIGLTASYVCTWNLRKFTFLLCFLPSLESSW